MAVRAPSWRVEFGQLDEVLGHGRAVPGQRVEEGADMGGPQVLFEGVRVLVDLVQVETAVRAQVW